MPNTGMIAKLLRFVNLLANWIRQHESDIILAIGVILISLFSFAVGYITAKEQFKEPIQIIEYDEQERQ